MIGVETKQPKKLCFKGTWIKGFCQRDRGAPPNSLAQEEAKCVKIKTLVPILLGFVLAAGIGVYAYQKNAPGKEEYMAAAIAYLEEQKTALDGAETIPMDIDRATGRVIRIHADSPYTIDRIISYLTNVTEVCRVEDIPELAYPLVYVGDKISGNNEKLYYSADKKA